MTIFEAVQKTIEESKENDCLMYLYSDDTGYAISRPYRKDWLFKAYPGGRKVFSVAGDNLVKEAEIK